ncbi:MAG: hypothetical protein EXQ96_04390 [Alphaproteobacteria bacterium]|nr:hypothetical protein [Alphaproteobacteria bacterium]
MTPEMHQAKAERIENSFKKCTTADVEACIEVAMLAGTHWFNFALHKMGVSPPQKDALHAQYMLDVDRYRLNVVAPDLLAAMDEVEGLRALHVRGNAPGGGTAAKRALDLLAQLRQTAKTARPPA